MNERELIEMAMKSTGLSQEKLAERIGKSGASLSQMRNGKGTLGDDVYVTLAELAGLDPALVLIEKHASKASPHTREIWKRIGSHLHTAAAVAMVAVILSVVGYGSEEAKASTNQQVSASSEIQNNKQIVWIMRTTISAALRVARSISGRQQQLLNKSTASTKFPQ